MFESSAMAGTVLMEDTFDPRFFYKGGEDRSLIIGGNEFFKFSHYKGSNDLLEHTICCHTGLRTQHLKLNMKQIIDDYSEKVQDYSRLR